MYLRLVVMDFNSIQKDCLTHLVLMLFYSNAFLYSAETVEE